MEKKEKMVIHGNEFYEIDLECIKRRQEGKECRESQEEAGHYSRMPQSEKNTRWKRR